MNRLGTCPESYAPFDDILLALRPVAQRLKDIILLTLMKLGSIRHSTRHNHQSRRSPELPLRLPQLRQEQHRQQEGAHHIRLHPDLRPHHLLPLGSHGDAGILDQRIDPVEPLRPLRKRLDRVVRAQIELPRLGHARAARGVVDGFHGGIAFGDRSTGDDDAGRVEPDVMARGFQTQTSVGTGDDVDLAGAVLGDDG